MGELRLLFGNGYELGLESGLKVSASQVGLRSATDAFASVTVHPSDKSLLGLRNDCSYVWDAITSKGPRKVAPGQILPLTAGTRIAFGSAQATVIATTPVTSPTAPLLSALEQPEQPTIQPITPIQAPIQTPPNAPQSVLAPSAPMVSPKEQIDGPWLTFQQGELGPYTRAFIGLIRITPAGEKIILPKDRYGRSGAMAVSVVSIYDPTKAMITAGLSDTFPTNTVTQWAMQQDSLSAVVLADHIDGKGEVWGAVLNFSTQMVCFPIALSDDESFLKTSEMLGPAVGLILNPGGALKKLIAILGIGNKREKQWHDELHQFSVPIYHRVARYVEQVLNGTQSGKL